MRHRFALLLATGVVLNALCTSVFGDAGAETSAANRETATAEISLAETARQRASEAGAEWLATESLIEQARQAAAEQDWESALETARRARRQGELALEQAQHESTAWQSRVVR